MMNSLRIAVLSRWMLVLALAGGYCCAGGCWHDHHDDHDRGWHDDDHRDFHDDHHDEHHY